MTSPKSREQKAEAFQLAMDYASTAQFSGFSQADQRRNDFLAGHESRDQEIASLTHAAERHRDLAADRLAKIQALESLLAQAAEALQFYAGQAHDAHWDGCRFLAFDKFGCLDALASGPHVASQALSAIHSAGFGRNGQDGKGGGG